MAFIEKRIGPRGTRYRVRIRDPLTGELISRTFKNRKPAEDWLHDHESEKRHDRWRDRKAAQELLYVAVVANISTALDLAPATRVLYQGTADRYIRDSIGKRTIGSLTSAHVRQWIKDLSDTGVGTRTIQVARQVLGRTLRQAEADRVIEANPVRNATPPRNRRRGKVHVLEAHQVQALAGAAGPRDRALVTTAAWCGLRFGEAIALRLSDLDMLGRRLTVSRAVAEVRGAVTEGATKTGKVRTVPMPRVVVDALGDHLAAICADHEPEHHDDHLVFTAPDGGYIRRTNWRRRVWEPALRQAGLAGITPHDLRHFGAAVAIAAGAHPKMIQERLGHASITTTLDVYGHLFPSLDEDLVARLDQMAEPARPRAGAVVALGRR